MINSDEPLTPEEIEEELDIIDEMLENLSRRVMLCEVSLALVVFAFVCYIFVAN